MARYYAELLITAVAAGTLMWLATQSHLWWRRLLYTIAFEFSLFLLTFSGCSGMSNFPGQIRPVSAIGNLSVGELRWSFGLMVAIAASLAVVKTLQHVSSRWRRVAKVAIYGFVSLAAFVLCVQGCGEGCTRRFPVTYAPDGSRFARVQELDGGAMDSFHTAVMLRTRDRLRGELIFGTHDGPDEVKLTWADASHLRVDYDQWTQNGMPIPDHDFSCKSALGVSVSCVPHALEQK